MRDRGAEVVRTLAVLSLTAIAAVALAATPSSGGGCGYSYSAPYSYPVSYPVSYETIKYVDRVKYVDRPVYVAQYSPLLVTVPTYSLGYAAPAAPAGYGYPQAAPQQYGTPQAAPPAMPQATAPQASPCAASMSACEARAAKLEAEMASIRQTLAALPRTQSPATTPEPLPRERGSAPPAAATGLSVMAAKCAFCHDEASAAKLGDKFVLLKASRDGKQYEAADLTAADWQKVIDQVSGGKMPKKPKEATQAEFDQYGKLSAEESSALLRDAKAYLEHARK
jgi:hypothetical protein